MATAPSQPHEVARPRRPVSDAEYLARYEREVRRYVAHHTGGPDKMGPGETYLVFGRWAWLEDERGAEARWRRYAREHGGLRAMHPDGSWHPWQPWDERAAR